MKKIFPCIILLALATTNCYCQTHVDNPQNRKNSDEYKMQPIHLQSRWAQNVDPAHPLPEYPRPQMERNNWQSLNGLWEYAITDSSVQLPSKFDGKILVPFPLESALSGVQKKLTPSQNLWYKKTILAPTHQKDERIFINFGAIDWQATIIINNKVVGTHTGGYQNFSFDITNFIVPGNNEVLIKVYDPTDQGPNPHGKQVLNPKNIYYTPSSGIWQTVWLEKVPNYHICGLKSTPDIDNGTLAVRINLKNIDRTAAIEISALKDGQIVAIIKKPVEVATNNNDREMILSLKIPDAKLWSPDDPFLYDLSIKLTSKNKIVDEIKSYFGMRKIDIQKTKNFTRKSRPGTGSRARPDPQSAHRVIT